MFNIKKIFRITSMILIISVCITLIRDTAHAGEILKNNKIEENQIILGRNKENYIAKLYKKRLELCNDYEKNKEKIEQLDMQLEGEGSTQVSEAYVDKKLMGIENQSDISGEVSGALKTSRIAKPSERGVTWKSTRYITTYLGKQYEIQQLVAQPNSRKSSLSKVYSVNTISKSASKQAAKWNILKSVTGTLLGLSPEVGGTFTAIQTVYSCAKSYDSGLKATSIVKDVEASYNIHYVTEYTLCFIKPKGATDQSQVLGYAGNYSTVKISCEMPYISYSKSHVIPKSVKWEKTGTIASPKYTSGKWNYACKFYNNYKKGITGNCHLNLQNHVLKLNNNLSKKFRIPRPNYGF